MCGILHRCVLRDVLRVLSPRRHDAPRRVDRLLTAGDAPSIVSVARDCRGRERERGRRDFAGVR